MCPEDDAPPSSLEPADQQDAAVVQVGAAAFSGPLPPPFILRQYDEIVPGAADRILAMAESQHEHRHALEKRVIFGNVDAQARGQWMGFVLGLVGIIGGFFLIGLGHSGWGVAAIVGSLVSLITVFVVGQRRQRQERERKQQALETPKQQSLFPGDEDT